MRHDHGGSPLRADPTDIADTATRLLDLGLAASDRHQRQLSAVDIDPTWVGTGESAAAFAAAYARGLADLTVLLDLLAQGLAGDADRLYQVAFGLQATEVRSTARIGG